MLKFSRRNKKLVIPVGINPNYNIEVKDLYTTKDADVVAGDIIAGKVAYGSDGKIIGSLDLYAEKQDSYNNGYNEGNQVGYENGYTEGNTDGYKTGYESGESVGYENGYNEGISTQKDQLIGIEITENGTYTRENGYNEVVVNVPDLNGSYDEGYSDGYNEGNQVGYENGYTEGNTDGYNNGYSIGVTNGITEQKSKLESITITENGTYNKEDGYNNVVVEVPDLNGSYDDGYSDGIVAGREEIIEEQSDATITPNNVLKGYIGYGANNEKVVGEFEFVEGFDFGKIGYSQSESNECNEKINEYIVYSKSLYDSIKPNIYGNLNLDFSYNNNLLYAPYPRIAPITGLNFNNCKNLIYIPKYETGKLTYLSYTFNNCESLVEIPQIDTSNVTDFSGCFYGCKNLKNISLLDCGKVNTFTYASYNRVFRSCESLENLGGLKDLGKSFTTNQLYVYLTDSPKLTYSSLINLINNLYDMTLNTSFKNTPTLYLHSSTKALLSDEDIAIATSKGWTIQ